MTIYLFALLIGAVAGLRAFAAPAVVSFAAYLGWLPLEGTWASFLGYWAVPYALGGLAILEFVADQLPNTPARTEPLSFGARLIQGAFCGAVLGTATGATASAAFLGGVGAILGTLGGYAVRTRLTRKNQGHDRPVAFLEDAVAIVAALWIVTAVR